MATQPVEITVFGKTDVGQTREHNEDTFLVADLTRRVASLQPEVRQHEVGPRGTLLMVADGMGGAAAGEVASHMATEAIFGHLISAWSADSDDSPQRFAYRIKEAVELANSRINAHAKENPDVRGMGTTATVAGILDSQLYLAQVGDSRAYLVRKGVTTQITKDQSLMQRLVDAGELTEEEAEQSERKNIILQALGPDPRVKVDLTWQTLCRGDLLLLCSDGLSGQVKREEIAELAGRIRDPQELCASLIALANERGGPDNITAVVAQFGGAGLEEPPASGGLVGHQVYPLLEEDSTTEPVPVYTGSPAPQPIGTRRELPRWAMVALFSLLGLSAILILLLGNW